jgi:preprotein translocase subunit SecY
VLGFGIGIVMAIKAKIPAQIMPAFNKLINQVKGLLSNSLHQAFIVCIIITIIALVAVLFMKEIPLAKKSKPESGVFFARTFSGVKKIQIE